MRKVLYIFFNPVIDKAGLLIKIGITGNDLPEFMQILGPFFPKDLISHDMHLLILIFLHFMDGQH